MDKRTEPPGAADAIVVSGAAVWSGGLASPTLRRRTMHAVNLYKQGRAPLIVLCGGLGKHPPTEAEAMASLCRNAGIDDRALLLEDRSTTTCENVAFSAELLRIRGLSRVLVVSSTYHLPRVKLCFRYLGFETKGSAPPRETVPGMHSRNLQAWLREITALPWYCLTLPWQMKSARRAASATDE
ncbi:MAG: YdcF family protein [Pseudomonadota bacterium]